MIRPAQKNCLGTVALFALSALSCQAGPPETSLPPGSWGGEHIRLDITETGTKVEYDCAFGRLDSPPAPDQDGKFETPGIYLFELGGPRQPGDAPIKAHAALYSGWTDGKDMRLMVMLLESGNEIGTFRLSLGKTPQLDKCL